MLLLLAAAPIRSASLCSAAQLSAGIASEGKGAGAVGAAELVVSSTRPRAAGGSFSGVTTGEAQGVAAAHWSSAGSGADMAKPLRCREGVAGQQWRSRRGSNGGGTGQLIKPERPERALQACAGPWAAGNAQRGRALQAAPSCAFTPAYQPPALELALLGALRCELAAAPGLGSREALAGLPDRAAVG